MRVFAGVISAQRKRGDGYGSQVASEAVGCITNNKNEAVGWLMKICRERMPLSDGWHSHSAGATDITNTVWEKLEKLDPWDPFAEPEGDVYEGP